ncbi:MAG: glycoside hydrolase family 2 protein [Armatimonadota bacterium]
MVKAAIAGFTKPAPNGAGQTIGVQNPTPSYRVGAGRRAAPDPDLEVEACIVLAKSSRAVIPLNGVWRYQKDPERTGESRRLFAPETGRGDWGEMTIPANWYKTEVGDYHGVIWFAREFELPKEMKGRQLMLRFGAVDYIADVWLNGEYLGRHEGFFAPFTFGVTAIAREGKNTLVVRVDSPKDPTEYRRVPDPPDFPRPMSEEYNTRKPVALTTIKGSCIDFWHRPGWETQFSQDGNTGGIWQGVELIATGELSIGRCHITPKLVRRNGKLDGTALLVVDAEVTNHSSRTVRAVVGFVARGKTFESREEIAAGKEFVLAPGSNRVKLVHTVKEPVLWWCWDHGRPDLYEMQVTAKLGEEAQDEVWIAFGIRELALDEKGHWHLNGKRVFARGMRYHSSIWLGEANERLFLEDLGRMRELHINAIRIGSHVEQPRFYELCDEMGFLLWQVFPLHWGNYADTDELIERAAPMMREMVELLYNHPSLVMWSVFKEPNVYQFEPRPNLYGRLCEVMKDAAATVDPLRWVHLGDYGEGAQNVMTGGWGEVYWDFRKVHSDKAPQKVEFGTESVAPLETAKQILKPEEQWPPVWDRWYYLNLDPYWLHLQGIDVTKLSGLEELIERSQTWAARQIKESVEYIRQRKWKPNASMFLYFWSDPWPCLGGSGLLDYYRRKYKAYDIFGMVYSPVLVSIEWVKETHVLGHEKVYAPGEPLVAKVWVTNDRCQAYEKASLRWWVKDARGKVLAERSHTLSVPEDSSQVVEEVSWPIPGDAKGVHRMEVELASSNGEELSRNWFEFRVI